MIHLIPEDVVFPLSDQQTHSPEKDAYWQESFVLLWGDPSGDYGGFLRLGYAPNLLAGDTTLWCHAFTPKWVYGSSRDFALRSDDVGKSLLKAGEAARYEFDGEDTRWVHSDDEVTIDLQSTLLHPPVALWRPQDSFHRYPHYEAACRVKGRLSIRGDTVEVDALGYRDHSWGVRHWWKRKTHRWLNGVFGPDLSMCLLTFHSDGDNIRRLGYVVRDGVVHYSQEIDIVAHMEADGATHRGGTASIVLESGECLNFEIEPMCEGFYAYRKGSGLFESICRIRHQGRVGIGDFELSENSRMGQLPATSLINGIEQDGVHPRRTP
ncbi:hypothetical protein K3M67_05545 [Sphingobium sp. V4]|uniref:DUF7065 domain-containing protein n=1 Tax=Sphingobium sp. V4 TaxID=3038927 RepID=UPI002557F79C|nr:hypothetical protein [Sphingobium sp. V4]WIW89433.1 hypothetical protein K3M67_05545 [Sphingobium sp. V4]